MTGGWSGLPRQSSPTVPSQYTEIWANHVWSGDAAFGGRAWQQRCRCPFQLCVTWACASLCQMLVSPVPDRLCWLAKMEWLGAEKKPTHIWVDISSVFSFWNLQDAGGLYRREGNWNPSSQLGSPWSTAGRGQYQAPQWKM